MFIGMTYAIVPSERVRSAECLNQLIRTPASAPSSSSSARASKNGARLCELAPLPFKEGQSSGVKGEWGCSDITRQTFFKGASEQATEDAELVTTSTIRNYRCQQPTMGLFKLFSLWDIVGTSQKLPNLDITYSSVYQEHLERRGRENTKHGYQTLLTSSKSYLSRNPEATTGA